MSKPSEEISKYNANSAGKTDSNLANDALHLGGIEAEDYATKKYVQDYHNGKENLLKEYIDSRDTSILQEAKSYTDNIVNNQDFSNFAKIPDIQALDNKLSNKINECGTTCSNKIKQVVDDVNSNFDDVNKSITNLNNKSNELFQSVSNGKQLIAGAITDKGVNTSANDSFNQMATNIRKIVTIGSGGIPEGYIDTSDATATASDILRGKTAYANGKKITGTYNTEINPDNPSKITTDLELIYGVKEGEFTVNNVYSSVPSMYAISCDRRVLAIYDNENKTIKMYQRSGNSYVKAVTDKGEILTPDYTLADLGIAYNDDLEVCQLNFSSMNNNFDCKLAICLRKTKNTITGDKVAKQWYVHIFSCSTYYGQLEVQNKEFSNGEDGTIVNHHILESENTSICSSLGVVFSSSNWMDLLVNVNESSITVYHLYEYLGLLKDTYRKGYSFSHSMVSGSLRFFGNSRLISYWYTTNNSYGSYTVLIVLNELLTNKIGESNFYPNTAFTENGEYAFYLNNGGMSSNGGILDKVNIDYSTGNITRETKATELFSDDIGFTWCNGMIQFDKSGRYIYIQGETQYYNSYICYIEDYEQSTALQKVQTLPSGSNNLITLLSDWNTGIYTRYGDIRLYNVELDTDIIKGIKYNGNYYILSNGGV